jgi:hypothetical protein
LRVPRLRHTDKAPQPSVQTGLPLRQVLVHLVSAAGQAGGGELSHFSEVLALNDRLDVGLAWPYGRVRARR